MGPLSPESSEEARTPGPRRAARARPARRGDKSPWGEHPRILSAKRSVRDAPPRVLASGGGESPRRKRVSGGTGSGGACRPLLKIQHHDQLNRKPRKNNRKTAQSGKEK